MKKIRNIHQIKMKKTQVTFGQQKFIRYITFQTKKLINIYSNPKMRRKDTKRNIRKRTVHKTKSRTTYIINSKKKLPLVGVTQKRTCVRNRVVVSQLVFPLVCFDNRSSAESSSSFNLNVCSRISVSSLTSAIM